ncbi:MAG: AAA family ATPase [Candidatus Eremiobacteraeota bacterium]|nr:AAA family ATPase [Candidatus Eremiobacteraeota bacterium]
MASGSADRLRITLFGRAAVVVPDDPGYRYVPRRRGLELLALLLLARGPLARASAAFALWPDDDEGTALGTFRRALHLLGKSLPTSDEPWLVAVGDDVVWAGTARAFVDVDAFERAYAEGDLAAAVALYRGELLDDIDAEWILPHRERYARLYHDALSRLVAQHRRARELDRAESYAERLLESDPWREDVVRQYVAIRYERGDRTGALRAYERFAERLRREMGVEPMPETRALRDRILRSEDVRDDLAQPGVAPVAARRAAAPCVGRDAEIAQLRALWTRAATHGGTSVFVTGEPGIGKTTLAGLFAAVVEGEGGRVLLGGTSSPERFPYQAVVDAFASALPLLDAPARRPLWFDVLAPLVPGWPAGDGAPPLGDPQREAARVFDAVVQALRALASRRPLLLVAEDVHWAGSATTDLLGYLMRALAGTHALLVVTARDGAALPPHVRRLRDEMLSRGLAHALSLGPLAPADVGALAAALGEPEDAHDAAALARRSGGNPLLVQALLRAGDDASPALADAIGARLEHLGDAARGALDLAAVFGAAVDVALLRAASGWPESALYDALAELLGAQLLRETYDRARLRYAFTHEVVREAVYARIVPERRAHHHHIVASVLQTLPDDECTAHAFDLAEHYAACGEHAAAARWYLRAAEAALDVYAHEDAAARASRGLGCNVAAYEYGLLGARARAWRRIGDQAAERDDLERMLGLARAADDVRASFAALEALARLALEAGDAARASSLIAEMTPLAEPGPRADGLLAELDARVATIAGALARAAERARAAVGAYDAAGDERAALEALLQCAVAESNAGDFDAASADLDRARDLAERLTSPALAIRVASTTAATAIDRQQWRLLRESGEAVLRLAVRVGDRCAEADGHHYLGLAAAREGAFDVAAREYDAALAISETLGGRRATIGIMMNKATLLNTQARWLDGLALLDRTLALARAHGDRRFATMCEINRCVALYNVGRFDEALEAARSGLSTAEAIGSTSLRAAAASNVAGCLVELGRPGEAAPHYEDAVALLRALAMRSSLVTALTSLVNLRLDRDDAPAAFAAADELRGLVLDGDDAVASEPAEALWAATRAFERAGDVRADALLAHAGDALRRRLASLGAESADARRYADLPWCRALRTALDDPRRMIS